MLIGDSLTISWAINESLCSSRVLTIWCTVIETLELVPAQAQNLHIVLNHSASRNDHAFLPCFNVLKLNYKRTLTSHIPAVHC